MPLNSKGLKALLADANVGRRYWGALIADIQDDFAHKQDVIDYINDYNAKEHEGIGMLLHGGHGSGKTTILSVLIREALRRAPCSAWFMPMPEVDWYARHRNEAGPTGVPVWEKITRAQIVAIDDVGSERDAAWNDAWLEEVLRLRYNAKLATHISSNIGADVLFERYGWLQSLSRDASVVVEVQGEMR